jgi:hypothetical protein
MNFYSASLILILFTVAFILMDEYVAKPIRRKRLQEKAKTDPVVRRALEIAAEVERRHAKKD